MIKEKLKGIVETCHRLGFLRRQAGTNDGMLRAGHDRKAAAAGAR